MQTWLAAPTAHSIVLSGSTLLAHDALGGNTRRVVKFPYMIGRGSAHGPSTCKLELTEPQPDQVSSNHCAILWAPTMGGFFIQDLGSQHGTIVNGQRIGRGSGKNMAALHSGTNEIVVGDERSPYRFEVRLPEHHGKNSFPQVP
jgi:pSer/pThr/pTyr-binding forkhead associated (FHA) protein